MNWITNSVLPKIKALVQPREVPENFWTKCPNCGEMIFHRQLEDNLQVCPKCNYHLKLAARARLESLFDSSTLHIIELERQKNSDPLKFKDLKKYSDRLKDARTNTKQDDAILIAEGNINGRSTIAAVFSFEFMGGSMGIAVGDAILKSAELAVSKKAPLIIFPASGGARMQEGILSLMQLPRTVIATQIVKEAGLPLIIVLTNPTTGGVTASFAMLGDIHIAEPGAIIGFAGKRVIQETIRESLPEDFQSAEYLLEHGMIDMVVDRHNLKEKISGILSILMDHRNNK
ncbi:MAG: acetyl-CoA carboxylase, carboxyltransferase subunit beta [Thalassobaculaceae bacterium]|jgi:acetyl-CoA carboxylase carboxyl transferase subunit beta|nr:acetyl-CoA carboxylase carboxyl transferase subunit beta [Rhodospirillaceae bacterium]|tara:strand:- start:3480 stop:4343 length:864 start_codon:yes stop_codon:yes gene_type:complete